MAHQIVRAVVLLSGGIDSTCCLANIISGEGRGIDPSQVRAVSVYYGQKHKREVGAAQAVAEYYHVDHCSINLANSLFVGGGSTLIDPDKETPSMSYKELEEARGISPTYVPFRNGNLLSAVTALILSHWQPTQEEPIDLWAGMHAEDEAHDAYPDCSREFLGSMAAAIYIGSYRRVRLVIPFQHFEKSEIVSIGDFYGAPLHLTYSCYRGGQSHCGACPTCRARRLAFREANVLDPTEYQE